MTKYRERIHWICNTSVDDAKTSIQNETDLTILDMCLHYEMQHQNRSTMIRNLRARIRMLEND